MHHSCFEGSATIKIGEPISPIYTRFPFMEYIVLCALFTTGIFLMILPFSQSTTFQKSFGKVDTWFFHQEILTYGRNLLKSFLPNNLIGKPSLSFAVLGYLHKYCLAIPHSNAFYILKECHQDEVLVRDPLTKRWLFIDIKCKDTMTSKSQVVPDSRLQHTGTFSLLLFEQELWNELPSQ